MAPRCASAPGRRARRWIPPCGVIAGLAAALAWRASPAHCFSLGRRPPSAPTAGSGDFPGSRRARVGARASSGAGQDVVALFKEQWRSEAKRCFAEDDSGKIPGWIGDFTAEGLEYEKLSKLYMKVDQKPQPSDDRPWRLVEGEAQAEVPGGFRDLDYDQLLEFLGDEAGGTLLDLGCGDGWYSRRLVRSGKFDRVFALDVDWGALEQARAVAEQERLGPKNGLLLMRGDIQDLPFGDGLIDGAWWGMGAHQVNNATKCLQCIHAALRPGGKLRATTKPGQIEEQARAAGFSQVSVVENAMMSVALTAVK